MKRSLLEKIASDREMETIREKIIMKRLTQSRSTNNFRLNKDQNSSFNLEKDHTQNKPPTSMYDKLFPKKSIHNKMNDSSTKLNSNSNNNIKISNNNSNVNSNNNSINLGPKEKPKPQKSIQKSNSLTQLENKQMKISQALLEIIKQEEEMKSSKRQRKDMKRLDMLYSIQFRKNEELNLKKRQLDELRQEAEMQECTFKPIINNDYIIREKSQHLNNDSQFSFYERASIWKKKKYEKTDLEKKRKKTKEFENCTFQPSISRAIPIYNNVDMFDSPTLNYFQRVQNARQEKVEKESKVTPNYNELYDQKKKNSRKSNKKEAFGTFSPANNNTKREEEPIVHLRQSLRNQLSKIDLEDYEHYGIPPQSSQLKEDEPSPEQ